MTAAEAEIIQRGMRWRPLHGVALLLPIYLLFQGLTAFGLLNNVEGMYAEIAREMLVSGDWHHWIIPHLNGVPYIEKPPLLYWTEALSMALFGINDFAVRLVPALSAVASMGTVLWYGQRVHGPRFGVLAAFVLGTSVGFVFLNKVAMTDPLLSSCLNAAVLVSHVAWLEQRPTLLRWAYGYLALAVLTKGFVALALFVGIWGSYGLCCARRDIPALLRFLLAPGAWAVFLLVAGPWHLAAALSLKEFSWFYFINEHVLRFLGLREPKDYYSGSPLYYLPRLALMFFPWFLVLLMPLVQRRPLSGGPVAVRSFLWMAVLLPLVFFSASAAKANYYVIVCLPALALLAALKLEHQLIKQDTPWLMTMVTLTGMVAWGLLLLRIWAERQGIELSWLPLTRDDRFWLSAAFVLLTTVGTLFAANRRHVGAVLLLGAVMVPIGLYVSIGAGRVEERISARLMAERIAADYPDEPLYLYQDYEDYSALPFYLQRGNLPVADQQSADLAFGLRLGRNPEQFPSLGAFAAQQRPVLLLILDARVRAGLPPLLEGRLERLTRVGNATLYRVLPK